MARIGIFAYITRRVKQAVLGGFDEALDEIDPPAPEAATVTVRVTLPESLLRRLEAPARRPAESADGEARPRGRAH